MLQGTRDPRGGNQTTLCLSSLTFKRLIYYTVIDAEPNHHQHKIDKVEETQWVSGMADSHDEMDEGITVLRSLPAVEQKEEQMVVDQDPRDEPQPADGARVQNEEREEQTEIIETSEDQSDKQMEEQLAEDEVVTPKAQEVNRDDEVKNVKQSCKETGRLAEAANVAHDEFPQR